MDEVPVVSANPVNTIINKPEKPNARPSSNQLLVSLKNLVYMLPLAMVILIQLFFLGKSFGTFSTLPWSSFTSFIFLASMAIILLFLQMLQRSIIYSTIGGVILLSGIFYAWFGDFHSVIFSNLQNVGTIIKSAWSRKDIPFPLLIAGIMTFSMTGIAVIQFLTSLFVKSFFESIFGKDWGDGRWVGFAGAIALLASLHISFNIYSSSASNFENRQLWQQMQKYKPVEKFLTSTPGAVMFNKSHIYTSHGGQVRSISLETGRVLEEKRIKSSVIRKGFARTETPVFFSDREMICFNAEMNLELWRSSFPASFTNLAISSDQVPEIDTLPQTAFFIESGKKLLVYYNYGFIGLYDMTDGKNLWLNPVDRQTPARNIFSDDFPSSEYFIESGERLIFSCQNGFIKAISKKDGSEIWCYKHENPKFNGKPQKAFLSSQPDRVLASFKSGEMITLALENGREIYLGKNETFTFADAPGFSGLEAQFLTDDGFFYITEVDGAKVAFSVNLLPKKLDFLPVLTDLEQGVVAHRGEAFMVTGQKVKKLLNVGNKVFATTPVFDEKMMYIGTQDGWVYCLHTGSEDLKWKIHVNGELEKDSLLIADSRLIVRTRSGSLVAIDRRF